MCTSEWTDFVVNFMESFKTNGLKSALNLVAAEMWDCLTEAQSEWLQATTSTLELLPLLAVQTHTKLFVLTDKNSFFACN